MLLFEFVLIYVVVKIVVTKNGFMILRCVPWVKYNAVSRACVFVW